MLFLYIIFFASAPVEERFLTLEAHLPDIAAVRACRAFEGRDGIGAFAQIEALERASARAVSHGEDRHTDGAGYLMMGRHGDGFPGDGFKCRNHGFVRGNATLEENMVADRLARFDFIQVIVSNGISKPG